MEDKFDIFKRNAAADLLYDKGPSITQKEYSKLTEEEKSDYSCEAVGLEYTYFKKIPVELTDDQLRTALLIETYKLNKDTNKNIRTVKSIMVFWLIISIIGLLMKISR